MKVHHIGYLVKNIENAVLKFEKLGFICTGEMTKDSIRKIDIVFLENDQYTIELISPYDDDSIVASLMQRYKNTAYHFCYNTTSILKETKRLEKEGFKVLGEPIVAPAIGNCNTVFLIHPHLGLIELVEVQ